MNDYSENIDVLIAKVIAEEASAEELQMFDTWLNAAEENRLYFEENRRLIQAIDDSDCERKVDVNKAWNTLERRINENGKIISIFRKPAFLRAAASILLVATLSFLIYKNINVVESTPLIIAANEKVHEQQLPDGSKVIVNKHSEIAFTEGKKGREVKLKGEAFFEVKHDEENPFTVVIDEVFIQDIGTAFNVKELPELGQIEVNVEEGEVQFFTSANKGVNLKKGEKAIYTKATKTFVKELPRPSENIGSYRSRMFHFEENTLSEVIHQLNQVYEKKIVLADSAIGDCRISVDFNDEELDLVVSILAETLDLKTDQSAHLITLSGKPCSR